MPLFDTHSHYNLEPLFSGQQTDLTQTKNALPQSLHWQKHWQNAQLHHIQASIIVGADLASSQTAMSIANQTPNLFAAIGLHPEEAEKFDTASLQQQLYSLHSLLTLAPAGRIVAIGEVGLDFYHQENRQSEHFQQLQTAQEELFTAQIDLANQSQLPLIIHLRDDQSLAYDRCLELLRQHFSFATAAVFHCASGSPSFIDQTLQLPNSYFGFDGNITFKNAENLRQLFAHVAQLHPEKVLLETDCPYLAPVPYRGKICEPWMLATTAEFIQHNLQFDTEICWTNAQNAFALSLR